MFKKENEEMPGIFNNMSGPPMGGMGMGGPTGKWINMRTGKTILVKDTFTEGDRMTVMCSDGRMIPMSEFSRDYVQMDESQQNVQQQTPQVAQQARPALDESLLMKGMGPRPAEPSKMVIDMPQDTSYTMDDICVDSAYANAHNISVPVGENILVDKLLEKCKAPVITVDLKWDNAPMNELNMLKTIYDGTDEEIVNTIVNKFVSLEAIKEQMTNRVNELLNPKKVGEKKPVKNKES